MSNINVYMDKNSDAVCVCLSFAEGDWVYRFAGAGNPILRIMFENMRRMGVHIDKFPTREMFRAATGAEYGVVPEGGVLVMLTHDRDELVLAGFIKEDTEAMANRDLEFRCPMPGSLNSKKVMLAMRQFHESETVVLRARVACELAKSDAEKAMVRFVAQ